jgi:hypothetical protein
MMRMAWGQGILRALGMMGTLAAVALTTSCTTIKTERVKVLQYAAEAGMEIRGTEMYVIQPPAKAGVLQLQKVDVQITNTTNGTIVVDDVMLAYSDGSLKPEAGEIAGMQVYSDARLRDATLEVGKGLFTGAGVGLAAGHVVGVVGAGIMLATGPFFVALAPAVYSAAITGGVVLGAAGGSLYGLAKGIEENPNIEGKRLRFPLELPPGDKVKGNICFRYVALTPESLHVRVLTGGVRHKIELSLR